MPFAFNSNLGTDTFQKRSLVVYLTSKYFLGNWKPCSKLTTARSILQAKAAFALAKDFFGAQNWRDQLISANAKLDQVLGDLEASIVSQGFVITVGIAEGVQRLEDDMKSMMRMQMSQVAPADGLGLPTYFPFQITMRKRIAKGGNSHVFEAEFPDSVHKIAYKRCMHPSSYCICSPPPYPAVPPSLQLFLYP
jgi:hypothetical protein